VSRQPASGWIIGEFSPSTWSSVSNGIVRLEQDRGITKFCDVAIPKGGDVVQNPKTTAHGTQNQIAPKDGNIGNGGYGKVLLEFLPATSIIERHEHPKLCPSIQKSFANGVFP